MGMVSARASSDSWIWAPRFEVSQIELTPNLPTKITPAEIPWRKLSGEFPMAWEFCPLNQDSAWAKPSEIQNVSPEIGRMRTGWPCFFG